MSNWDETHGDARNRMSSPGEIAVREETRHKVVIWTLWILNAIIWFASLIQELYP